MALDRALAQGLWVRPGGARAVVLFVHPQRADCVQAGQRFIADVLAANGLATLSIALSRHDDGSLESAWPDAVQTASLLQQVVDRLESDTATRGLPLALVGVHEAAAPCAEALGRGGLQAVKSCVWLDGPVDHRDASVAAWTRPTLCLAGRHGIGAARQPWRGLRRLPAPHRLVKLPQRSRPEPSAGVHQAMACELLGWLQRTLPAATAAAPQESIAA
ncbi:MAG: hypothetical protein AB7U92_01410 [Piscinibacter sp.]|uniref:hypothetical protein n=1 Tax=Piscinibacter sp. TaxID=1903157 RepID=UPI003D1337C9